MTVINIVDNEKQISEQFETSINIKIVSKLIHDLLAKQDVNLFITSIPIELMEFLCKAFSISIKELNKYFKHKFETISFIETMMKFDYLVKYHTTYKITSKFLDDISIPTNENLLDYFSINENVLFNEKLGLNVIQYSVNSNSFQQNTFIRITEYSKKESIEILNYLIYKGYISKTGTTYHITEKFKNKAAEYKELFEETKEE